MGKVLIDGPGIIFIKFTIVLSPCVVIRGCCSCVFNCFQINIWDSLFVASLNQRARVHRFCDHKTHEFWTLTQRTLLRMIKL